MTRPCTCGHKGTFASGEHGPSCKRGQPYYEAFPAKLEQRLRGRPYRCEFPGCNTAPDCPMLKDEVWDPIMPHDGLLCIEHTEELLNRQLTVDDLMPCVGNAFTFLLYDRLEARRLRDNNDRRILG